MSAPDRKAMLDREHPELSMRRQCAMSGIARSGVYRLPRPANDAELGLMRRIDALFTQWPFLGSRRMTALLRADGHSINRKRVRRLMRRMGIAALGPKPRTTTPAPGHKVFPYLLRGLAIDRPNQVWCADITYIPIGRGFLYLVAIMDWCSRMVLAWQLSNTMDVSFCVAALEQALARFGQARSLQHRPGQPVHLGRVHRRARSGRRAHFDGWTGPMDGQHLHRAALALAQTRGGLSARIRRRSRGAVWDLQMAQLLQSATSTSGARRSGAYSGVAEWDDRILT